MSEIDKIVIVTQPTWLDDLIEKHNTKEQARFYLEHSGGDFASYLSQHTAYYQALAVLKQQLPKTIRYQVVDKAYLPTFLFGANNLVIVLGRDGLVINTAKYLDDQPLLGVNPDPDRVEGILLKFSVDQVADIITTIQKGEAEIGQISLVQAELNNGQRVVGVNDLFIGHKSHQSARYRITYQGRTEKHSSSGLVISTGIGSTGWMKSIIASSMAIAESCGGTASARQAHNFAWDAEYLCFAVREAWSSRTTGASLVFGYLEQGEVLEIESLMPEGGVIFSDGMEEDHITFTSGKIAQIQLATKKISYYINPETSE